MNKSVAKIKEVEKVNKPNWNEKYKVWVVRVRQKTGWKAIWRKSKEDSHEVYEHLIKQVKPSSEQITEHKQAPKVVSDVPAKIVKPNLIQKMLNKARTEKETVVVKEK